MSAQHYFIVKFRHLSFHKEHAAVVHVEADNDLVQGDEPLPEGMRIGVGMNPFDDINAVDTFLMPHEIVEPGIETQQPPVGGGKLAIERLRLLCLSARAHYLRHETVGKGRLNAKAVAAGPAGQRMNESVHVASYLYRRAISYTVLVLTEKLQKYCQRHRTSCCLHKI